MRGTRQGVEQRTMKLIRIIRGGGAFLLFLGTMAPSPAQQDKASEKQTKSDKQDKADQPAGRSGQPKRTEQQARAWQQERGWLKPGGWAGKDTWQQHRANRWSSDHRTWAQRGGYGGSYIPQDQFGRNFGFEHLFRLRGRPVLYAGYPRFEYSGVSFLVVDPWPEYWSDNWYDFDDVYIVYDDGYYLCNRAYSQVKLAIAVVI
jgi:hypothetical protein